jgi:hypothetical protein
MALFSETHLKSHLRFCIPNLIFIGLTVMMGIKAELPQQLRKVSFTHAQTYLLSFQ